MAPYGPAARTLVPGRNGVDQLGSVAYRFDCYPQKLVIGSGRKGERVGGPPHRPGEQSPAEELSRFGIELAEVTAAKDDADHSGSFIDDVIDTQPVTPYLREWRQDPVPQYQSEADCAEEAPCHPKQGMTGQVGPSQLVGKGKAVATWVSRWRKCQVSYLTFRRTLCAEMIPTDRKISVPPRLQ
jgi:hypothetical protein